MIRWEVNKELTDRGGHRGGHLQCGRRGFDPWIGKIPRGRERLPTPVFWPGEFHGLCSPWGHKESDTTERLTLSTENVSCLSVKIQNLP